MPASDRLVHQPVSRRTLLAGAVVGGAGATFLGAATGAGRAAAAPASLTRRITVLGSTDLHGHIQN